MFSRLVSLSMAGGICWTLLYGCPLIGDKVQKAEPGVLILTLIGVLGGFAHGLGFSPRNIFLKFLCNRWIARVFMLSSLFL